MPKYKAQLRIPTEMYAYMEVSVEDTAENILQLHNEFTRLVKPREGLDEKTMNIFIDNMLLGNGKNDINVYQLMSDGQKNTVQCLKRGLKRITAHQDKGQNNFAPQ